MKVQVNGRTVNFARPVKIGVEGDNGVTDITFVGLPVIGDGQLVTLNWLTDGDEPIGDIEGLEANAEGYTFVVEQDLTQFAGRTVTAYLEITSGDKRWHTEPFFLDATALPPVEATLEPKDPTIINQIKEQLEQANAAADRAEAAAERAENAGGLTEETDPTVSAWAKAEKKPTYTADEVGARPSDWLPTAEEIGAQQKGDYALKSEIPEMPEVPTKLSQLAQDSENRTVTDAEKSAWDAKSDFSGSYNDLKDTPTLPTVPTNVSAFENDAGYLTVSNVFIAVYGETAFSEVKTALAAGREVVVRNENAYYQYAYINAAGTVIYFTLIDTNMLQVGCVYVSSANSWGKNSKKLESTDSKTSAVTSTNKTSSSYYPSVKAMTSYAVPIPTTAEVGQTIVVTAVDSSGKPTAWEATDLPDVSGKLDAPAYVVAEAERVADAVQAARTSQSLVLLCAGDIHTHMSNAQSVETTLHLTQGINEICKRVAVDGIAILGDSATGGTSSTVEDCKAEIDYLRENLGYTQGVPQIWMAGNHDHNSQNSAAGYLTADEIYTHIGANTTDKAVTDYDNLHRLYGYVDYDRQRVRVIYLNTSDITDSYAADYGMSTVQSQWFADALANTPSGWGAVVMSHHPINGYISTALGVLTIMDAYKGKQSGSVIVGGGTVTYDFSDAQGELICHLHGHIHNYQVAMFGENGVLSVTIPNGSFWRNNEYGQGGDTDWGDEMDGEQRVINKTAGTAEDTAFTALVIDRMGETIHALRYGAGVDRIVSYASVEVPETVAVTWYDGQRFSSSSGEMKSDDGVGQTSAYLLMDDLAVGEGYQITGLVFDGTTYANTYVTAYENDTYTGHYFVNTGMSVTYATHYNCVVAADGSSMTIYKTSAPADSSVSCKVGVTGAGVGTEAIVVKVRK